MICLGLQGFLMAAPVSSAPPAIVFGGTSFQSDFPFGVVTAIDVTPAAPLLQAKLYITMDGVTYYTQDALIPAHQPGETIRIETRWQAKTLTRDASPPWMPMQIWWQMTDAAGNTQTSNPQQHTYADSARRIWTINEGAYATVYTYGQSGGFINSVVGIADAAIPQLQNAYGFALPFRPAIVVYNSAGDGDGDMGNGAFGSYVVGRAYPGTSGLVLLARNDNAYLQRLIYHELAHLFQYQIGPRLFDAPHWFIEGDAKSQEPPASRQRSVGYARDQAYTNGLPDLASWDSRNYSSEAALDHALLIGASFVVYLREVYGAQAMASFYANWRNTLDFYGAFVTTFGVSLQDLDVAWRGWLANNTAVASVDEPTVANVPAIILPDIPEGMARVNAYWLNFRDSPQLEDNVLALLNIGQLVLPLGRDESSEWILVELADGAQGWLFAEYLDYDGDIDALTVSLY